MEVENHRVCKGTSFSKRLCDVVVMVKSGRNRFLEPVTTMPTWSRCDVVGVAKVWKLRIWDMSPPPKHHLGSPGRFAKSSVEQSGNDVHLMCISPLRAATGHAYSFRGLPMLLGRTLQHWSKHRRDPGVWGRTTDQADDLGEGNTWRGR